jgi:hypothetical protein
VAKGVMITMEEAKRYDVIKAVLDGKMTNQPKQQRKSKAFIKRQNER